jgi:hypothetical protein
VTFDERCGYVGTHPELRLPVTALSLGGLRRRIEALLLPEEPSETNSAPSPDHLGLYSPNGRLWNIRAFPRLSPP